MKTKRLKSSMVSYFAKIRSKIAEVGLVQIRFGTDFLPRWWHRPE